MLGFAAVVDCKMRRQTLKCVRLQLNIHIKNFVETFVVIGRKIRIVRTNIVIDDKLMDDTMRVTGLKTKREAVELGLRTLLRLCKQEEIRRFRGKLDWQGHTDPMRQDK